MRLNDTYGLLLDCSVNNQTEPQPTKCFAALKNEIEQKLNHKPATIGQTWMISGQLPKTGAKSLEDIAKECYDALMPGSNWEQDLEGKGHFLGATIFEFWRYRLVIKEGKVFSESIQSIQDNQHLIIILYPDEATARKAAKFYSDWMRLFGYRQKILWAYGQSRLLKQTIKNYFITIQECANSLRQEQSPGLNFKQIRKTLSQVQQTLTPYSINLNYLDYQSRTIELNLSNYKKRLARIQEKAEAGSDLKVLEKFSDLVTDKYLLQVTKDYENLSLGLSLLDSSINTLRSRVEVDSSERDRNFQNTVAIVGVGLGAGSLVASLNELGKAENDPVRYVFLKSVPDAKPWWLEPAIPLVYGLGAAVIAAALTWLVIHWRSRRREFLP